MVFGGCGHFESWREVLRTRTLDSVLCGRWLYQFDLGFVARRERDSGYVYITHGVAFVDFVSGFLPKWYF